MISLVKLGMLIVVAHANISISMWFSQHQEQLLRLHLAPTVLAALPILTPSPLMPPGITDSLAPSVSTAPTSVPPVTISPPATTTPSDDYTSTNTPDWACIRQHESGDNYSEDTGNGYYGAYQFSPTTWAGLGGTGLPSDAPPATQDALALALLNRSGWGQWPQTSAICGL